MASTPTKIKSGARLVYQGGTFNEIHAALAKIQRERNENIKFADLRGTNPHPKHP